MSASESHVFKLRKQKPTQIAPSTVTRDVELTGKMVEELVLSPKKLSWFHDDGIWELIPDCCLSHRLQSKTIHILYCVCVCVCVYNSAMHQV